MDIIQLYIMKSLQVVYRFAKIIRFLKRFIFMLAFYLSNDLIVKLDPGCIKTITISLEVESSSCQILIFCFKILNCIVPDLLSRDVSRQTCCQFIIRIDQAKPRIQLYIPMTWCRLGREDLVCAY